MKLKDLHRKISALMQISERNGELDIVIEINKDGSVGGTPCVNVDRVVQGIDWDNGKLIFISDVKLKEVKPQIKGGGE